MTGAVRTLEWAHEVTGGSIRLELEVTGMNEV